MDLLRAVLGDEKLNYLGYSYGTFLGATYAKLFPDRVGHLVLDGAIDPFYLRAGRSPRRRASGSSPLCARTWPPAPGARAARSPARWTRPCTTSGRCWPGVDRRPIEGGRRADAVEPTP